MRQNKARQDQLEPQRIEYAIAEIEALGLEVDYRDATKIKFVFKGEEVTLFPYSGWHTGKSITDGRGIEKLLKQLK